MKEFKLKPEPERKEYFVFGSNEAGRHGKGAALFAKEKHGAIYGQKNGLQGSSYAIPTKNAKLKTLSLSDIAIYVKEFIIYAVSHPEKDFRVTPIGCGLAGYSHRHIAPLFSSAPSNCLLPEQWTPYLKKTNQYKHRLMVGGSRSANNSDYIFGKLDKLTEQINKEDLLLITGGAAGADKIAERWAIKRGIATSLYIPLWDDIDTPTARAKHNKYNKPYNANAGHDRNAWMLAAASCAAFFWDGSSPGTKQAFTLAEKMKLDIRVLKVGPALDNSLSPTP